MADPTPPGATGDLLGTPPEFKTVDAATVRLTELQASAEWRDKVLAGDPAATREFKAITQRIAQGDDESLPGVAEDGQTILREGQISRSDAVDAIAHLREMGLSDEVIAEAFAGSLNSAEVVQRTHALYKQRMSDQEWAKRLLAGGMAERRELALMSVILSGQMVVDE